MSFIKLPTKFRKQWALIKVRIVSKTFEKESKDFKTLNQMCFLPSGRPHFLVGQITEDLCYTVSNYLTLMLIVLNVTQVHLFTQ